MLTLDGIDKTVDAFKHTF